MKACLLQAEGVMKPYAEIRTPDGRQFTFYHGDCLTTLLELPSGIADCVVTSPPYNLGVNYRAEGYDDSMPREEYLAWLGAWGNCVSHVLKPRGSLFCNLGQKPTDNWVAHQGAEVLMETFQLQNVIHWIKAISLEASQTDGDGAISVGHYKPINSPRFLNDLHEFIFHFTKDGNVNIDRLAVGVPYADVSNRKRFKASRDSGLRCRGNVWFIPYDTIQSRDDDRDGHPATFPALLPSRCIMLHGNLGTVIDPFVGTGASARAAYACGVSKFIGIDLDSKSLDAAVREITRLCDGV
jgi:site-specific DNA-methyltransferase (adenine-specific)